MPETQNINKCYPSRHKISLEKLGSGRFQAIQENTVKVKDYNLNLNIIEPWCKSLALCDLQSSKPPPLRTQNLQIFRVEL